MITFDVSLYERKKVFIARNCLEIECKCCPHFNKFDGCNHPARPGGRVLRKVKKVENVIDNVSEM